MTDFENGFDHPVIQDHIQGLRAAGFDVLVGRDERVGDDPLYRALVVPSVEGMFVQDGSLRLLNAIRGNQLLRSAKRRFKLGGFISGFERLEVTAETRMLADPRTRLGYSAWEALSRAEDALDQASA